MLTPGDKAEPVRIPRASPGNLPGHLARQGISVQIHPGHAQNRAAKSVISAALTESTCDLRRFWRQRRERHGCSALATQP